MKDSFKITTKTITGTALLTAIELILIVISNYLTLGTVNINLALIPIVVAATVYGPLSGLFLGMVNGLITIFSPSTQAIFMSVSPLGTVLICLLKTSLAGFLAGLIYIPFNKSESQGKKYVGALLASISVPLINTGIFSFGCYTFFNSWLMDLTNATPQYDNSFMVLLFVIIGLNFIIEFAISIVFSPFINMLINYYQRRVKDR